MFSETSHADAIVDVQQLAHHYAIAIDSRDLDRLVALFVTDVRATPTESGHDALRRAFVNRWTKFRRSVHHVTTHAVDLVSDADATGTVYCVGLHERLDGTWSELQFAYFDRYTRVDDVWLFRSRRPRFWGTRTQEHFDDATGDADAHGLPQSWPTWTTFWDQHTPRSD